MSGRIAGTVIALFGAGLRYAIKVAGKLVANDPPTTALAKSLPPVRRRPSGERSIIAETAPIVGAVLLAMTLGVASGLWINTGLASSPFDSPLASDHPLGIHATEQALATPVRDQPLDDPNAPSQGVAEALYITGPDKSSSAGAKSTRPDEAAGGARRAAGADTATPNARDAVGASAKTVDRTQDGGAGAAGGRATGGGGRCILSTDAGALKIRGDGGSATITLRLNGTTGPARIAASTPDWSDVVVFAGSQAYGNGVEVRWYTIRSVSKRAGTYSVSFTTPCGSKTIPVTVTQP
jgi:hypothetical protein